jgi:cob(I)alamin adenosyltransferase
VSRRIYTRTGDRGETSLFGGGRVSKAHPRVDAYGAVDELNATLGLAAALMQNAIARERVASLQSDLLAIGAHLATPHAGERPRPQLPALPEPRIATLESWIDEAENELPPLQSFILPGGTSGSAALHVARTVCRRAERRVVALAEGDEVDPAIVIYLNRLSDLLFVLARLENARAAVDEQRWQPRTR